MPDVGPRGNMVRSGARRIRSVVTLGGLVVIVLAFAAALLPATAGGATASGSYVSLGDSYTSGPFIPNQSLSPLGCLRSDHNYPHLVAPSLPVTSLRDPSCGGATTDDMTQPQTTSAGTNSPQFDSLGSDTRVVSLGIGGNDIGFIDIVVNCISPTPSGPGCESKYVVNGDDKIADAINATAPKVAAVLQGIHARSPMAKVFVVGYPAILPESGGGCWPVMPIASSDVPYLRAKEKQLNAMLATQAAANGGFYVDTYTPSIGHDACTLPGTKWVEPVVPTAPAAPVHPNALGEQGMANAVRARMIAAGV